MNPSSITYLASISLSLSLCVSLSIYLRLSYSVLELEFVEAQIGLVLATVETMGELLSPDCWGGFPCLGILEL